MMANALIIKEMVRVKCIMLMVIISLVTGLMTKNVDKECLHGRVAINM